MGIPQKPSKVSEQPQPPGENIAAEPNNKIPTVREAKLERKFPWEAGTLKSTIIMGDLGSHTHVPSRLCSQENLRSL